MSEISTIKVAVLDGNTITNIIYVNGNTPLQSNYVLLNGDCYGIGDEITDADLMPSESPQPT